MKINEDFALFYGILLGDGSIGKYKYKEYKNKFNYNINITCGLDDKLFFDNVVVPLLFKLTGRNYKYYPKKSCNAITFSICNKRLFYFLEKIGFPLGKKGINLHIPELFYKYNFLKFITQGLFATDGCFVLTKNPNKYYPKLEIHSISNILIEEVYLYLSSIGMKGSFYLCKRKKDKWFPRYKLQFNGMKNLLTFKEKIGFVNPKHQQKFLNFLRYSEKYDELIKGIPAQKQKFYRLEKMATPRFELGTSSS